MSGNSRENMEQAGQSLRKAVEHLHDAGIHADTGGDRALRKRIDTLKEGVRKEAAEITKKLDPEKGG